MKNSKCKDGPGDLSKTYFCYVGPSVKSKEERKKLPDSPRNKTQQGLPFKTLVYKVLNLLNFAHVNEVYIKENHLTFKLSKKKVLVFCLPPA